MIRAHTRAHVIHPYVWSRHCQRQVPDLNWRCGRWHARIYYANNSRCTVHPLCFSSRTRHLCESSIRLAQWNLKECQEWFAIEDGLVANKNTNTRTVQKANTWFSRTSRQEIAWTAFNRQIWIYEMQVGMKYINNNTRTVQKANTWFSRNPRQESHWTAFSRQVCIYEM